MSSGRIWFISDLHFHHANMVRGGRIGIRSQFANVEQMNGYIVEAINQTVADHDKLYVLGDVTLQRGADETRLNIVRQLKGHKRLVLGNHDHFPVDAYLRAGFEKVMAYREIAGVLFSHIPCHPSQFYRFKGNVHGHTHTAFVRQGPDIQPPDTNWRLDDRYLNVCVEAVNYVPVALDEIVARFNRPKEDR